MGGGVDGRNHDIAESNAYYHPRSLVKVDPNWVRRGYQRAISYIDEFLRES
jgi:hypothetical protein